MNIPDLHSLLDFRGRVVIVTGGGGGLGQGIALRFAQAGARVVVHCHVNLTGARAVVQRIEAAGGQALALMADLTQAADAASLVAQTVTSYGRVDVLINNAGIYPQASVLEMTPAQWDGVINANLRSTFLCTQAVARQMIQQDEGGAIVNITSIEAENPAPNHSHYSAAKAGTLMVTRAAAAELGRFNIRVNAVAPGLIWREGIGAGLARRHRALPGRRTPGTAGAAGGCGRCLHLPGIGWRPLDHRRQPDGGRRCDDEAGLLTIDHHATSRGRWHQRFG